MVLQAFGNKGIGNVDRSNDQVYIATTRVVQAVRDMVKDSASGLPQSTEQSVTLVKVSLFTICICNNVIML